MDYRSPDEAYYDRLVEPRYNSLSEQEQIDQCIQLSMVNSEQNQLEECLQLSMINYIEHNIFENEKKSNILFEKYEPILQKYKKINRYDVKINEFNNFIGPIIDDYCRTGISLELEEDHYNDIITTVNSIRLNNEEKELMNQLFSKK